MTLLNGEHATTDEHSHFRQDGRPVVVDIDAYMSERGAVIPVVTFGGRREFWRLPSLPAGWTSTDLVDRMRIGDLMMTADGKGRRIETLEPITLPADTLLYNLITDGSHTFYVNGYCAGGIINANDFDYATWQPRGRPWTPRDYLYSLTCDVCHRPAPGLPAERFAA
jgi:hypothetical protein